MEITATGKSGSSATTSVTTRIREMQPEPVWQVTRTRDAGMIGLVAILLHWPGMSHAYHMLVGFPAVGHAPWCQVFSAKPAQGVELSHVSGDGTERPESVIKDFGQTRIDAMMSTRLTPPAQRPAGWAEFRTPIHAMVKKEDGTIMPLCTWKRKEDKAAARVKANQQCSELMKGTKELEDWLVDVSKTFCSECKPKVHASFLVQAMEAALSAIQIWRYFEWVESRSNWADGISREALEDEWYQGHGFVSSSCTFQVIGDPVVTWTFCYT